MCYLQVSTGRTGLLASSGTAQTADIPLPATNQVYVVWSSADRAHPRRGLLHLVDLRTTPATTRSVAAVSSAITFAGGWVVAMAPGHGNLDVWQYTVPSGPARPITANGDACELLTAGGDRIARVENDPTGPTQDPMRIRALDLAAGGTPTKPVPGPNEDNPAVGDTSLPACPRATRSP